eukprot:scaffold3450_cov114-Cylindrotheca_fusiformis.AAC.18
MESELQLHFLARTPSPSFRDSRLEQDKNCNAGCIACGISLRSCGLKRDRVTRRGQNHLVLSPSASEAKPSFCRNKASNNCERRAGGFKLFSDCFLFLLILRLPWSVSAEESAPTFIAQPSVLPTRVTSLPSFRYSDLPTDEPSQSVLPSSFPSLSHAPSDLPSNYPTPEPTFETPIVSAASFLQRFVIGNGRLFFPTELGFIESLYIGSTDDFITDHTDVELKVESKCNITSQGWSKLTRRKLERGKKWTMVRRGLQFFQYVEVAYEMTYSSVYINVTNYPILFQQYINNNNDTIVSRMQTLGLNVSQVGPASRLIFITPEPTPSPGPIPSVMPSIEPSSSRNPSAKPSTTISLSPSALPTDNTPTPTPSSGAVDGPQTETVVIIVSVVVAGGIVLVGSLIYFRKRKLQRERTFQSDARRTREGIWSNGVQSAPHGIPSPKNMLPEVMTGNGIASPSESLISNQSLLSAGNLTGGDSGDEADATHGLADEFDQYKDQNLEKMRADVEGNLTGFDSMMSQALTRALIDEDDDHIDRSEFSWGGSRNGAEIEASALGEVTDWLKRKENASLKEK